MVLFGLLQSIFGSKNERELRRLWPIVEKINSLEAEFKSLRDDQLRAKTDDFKERLQKGELLDSILPEAFAATREASRRTLGQRHYDVQLIGGMVLHEGKIAEMKTGEGKTLCATLPVYLNALSGRGVHVVTVNDYLARRDAQWMSAIYSFLGLSTGVILSGIGQAERHAAYRCDITYGQNNEFGFDYLRDNMKLELAEKVQRDYAYAIVDEVDSILIDEARTPLIISGPSEKAADTYFVADKLVRKLKEGDHFTVELKGKQVTLTEEGVKQVEELLGIENLYDPKNIELVHHTNQALKAHATMKRDVDYVVRDGQVIIVDEFTGRLMAGRRWSDGLHQAVEAKEHVEIARENQTLATITFQNYFRMYEKLAGMTGTADTEAVEFKKIYNLDVAVIPTNKPMVRIDYSDVVFSVKKSKYKGVCDEIEESHKRGQPVLVGTGSIAASELVSEMLEKRDIPHNVLNAKHHEREAEIIAQAGRIGAVTISTNMAGRGTDIILGGNPEFLAAADAKDRELSESEYKSLLDKYRRECADERLKVVELGGLHIIGTERHESRRIDNQLRGRSGRQGDPGSSRFYVSLEDDLMRRFGGEKMQAIMARVGLRDEDAIEGRLVANAIERAQKKVEGYHFDIRKHLLEYDDVMTKQRKVIYALREKILHGEEVEQEVLVAIPDVVEDIILSRASEREPVSSWDVTGMVTELKRQFGFKDISEDFVKKQEIGDKHLAQEMFDYFREQAIKAYETRRSHFGHERMVKLSRVVFLQAIDHFWKEHLSNMDHLKEGIGLRGYGQKNPLHEYQREAYVLFSSMLLAIKSGVLQHLFLVELPSEEQIRKLEEEQREAQRKQEAAAKTIHEEVLAANEGEKGSKASQSSLNREQRRKREAYMRTHTDEVPESVDEEKEKLFIPRKKGKAAKKALRRHR